MQTFREFFGFGKKKKKPAEVKVKGVEDWREMRTSDEFYSALDDATAGMNLAKTKEFSKCLHHYLLCFVYLYQPPNS